MENPTKKLKDFLATHHPSLVLGTVLSTPNEAAVHVDTTTSRSPAEYIFRLGFPRSAPENARPLVLEVRNKNSVVWSFRGDVQPYVGISTKVRVHLYEMQVEQQLIFLLVVVNEGDPDTVVSILRVDGTRLSDRLEASFKLHIAKLWGMRYELTDIERRELVALLPHKPKR